jgi:hypothetical protein
MTTRHNTARDSAQEKKHTKIILDAIKANDFNDASRFEIFLLSNWVHSYQS